MLLVNSDETLIPLMSDPREVKDLVVWGATYGYSIPPLSCISNAPLTTWHECNMVSSINWSGGTRLQQLLEADNKLPALVRVL